MKPLAVQEFLRLYTAPEHGRPPQFALEELERRFAVKAVRHGTYSNLVLLKYNQIESPFKEPVVCDCRGIILDDARDWAVVCMTYRKFFNLGEPNAAELDWKTAKVYEKLDGSLIQLYHYDGRWHAATSGIPDAECLVGDFGLTFRDLFWKVAKAEGLRTGHLDPRCCYAFEPCTPMNRVVVQHDRGRLYLHGVRVLEDLQEVDPAWQAPAIGIELARTFPLRTAFDCGQAAMHLNPLAQEGYVAVDAAYNRVKIKSPAYVALHHAKDGLLSRRMMANTIRKGEADELRTALDAFPELADEFRRLERKHAELVYDAEQAFIHIEMLKREGHIGKTRKEFAQRATRDPRLAGVLFHLLDRELERSLRPAEAIIRAYFADLHEKAYARLLGLKDEQPKEIAA